MLTVVKVLGLVTVQDLGRRGRMHEALPVGGALVPSMMARANRAVGNPDGAAAIEVSGLLVVRAEAAVCVATGRGVRELSAREELHVASDPSRVAYVAVGGGLDVPIVLGGRGAHLSAGIGLLVRAGERFAIAASTTRAVAHDQSGARSRTHAAYAPDDASEICVVPGPDGDAFARDALEALVRGPWRISSSSDRVGTRLAGSRIERRADYVETSRPMVIGAIEVPRDGAPIVLGPEHPTTGGYPVVAVVAAKSLDAFHLLPLGGSVRFHLS